MTAGVMNWPGALPARRKAIAWSTLAENGKGVFRALGLGFMWAVTTFELAMIVGVPLLFPAMRLGALDPLAVKILLILASKSHQLLLPAVSFFLGYTGLEQLEHWATRCPIEI